MIILSHFQLDSLQPPNHEIKISVSTDLGLTQSSAILSKKSLVFYNNQHIDWNQIKKIKQNTNACFILDKSDLRPIKFFSGQSNLSYSLYPTASAPTMLVSGIPMHRIKDTDPWKDSHTKINALKGIKGNLLDTNTGLGYTAIIASEQASWVMTLEIEPLVLEICKQNPWSKSLFNNPKIFKVIADSNLILRCLPNNCFDNILHDPPTFSLAGDLYSTQFYFHLHRVLSPKGKLFHYIGNPESKTGKQVTNSVVQRLRKTGFKKITYCPEAFGILAIR